jgi:hypothetical protein
MVAHDAVAPTVAATRMDLANIKRSAAVKMVLIRSFSCGEGVGMERI